MGGLDATHTIRVRVGVRPQEGWTRPARPRHELTLTHTQVLSAMATAIEAPRSLDSPGLQHLPRMAAVQAQAAFPPSNPRPKRPRPPDFSSPCTGLC